MHGTICERRPGPPVDAGAALIWPFSSVVERLASAGGRAAAQARLAMATAGLVAVTQVSVSGSLIAQTTQQQQQAQCELSAIRDTRSPVAIQLIHSACNWLSLNGDSPLNERSRGYYICLVQELSGTQADQAAVVIVSACRTASPP